MKKLRNYLSALSVVALAGCSSLGPFDRNPSSRDLHRRLNPNYSEILAFEKERQPDFDLDKIDWLENYGRNWDGERIEPRASKSKLAKYFIQEFAKLIKENLSEGNTLRKATVAVEEIVDPVKRTYNNIKDWVFTSLGLEDARFNLKLKFDSKEMEITYLKAGIEIPLNNDAEDGSFRTTVRQYRAKKSKEKKAIEMRAKKDSSFSKK